MEIYKDSEDRTVTLTVPLTPIDGTLEASIYDSEGTLVMELDDFDTTDGISVEVPFFVVDSYDEFDVHFHFKYLEQSVEYDLYRTVSVSTVTPFLSVAECKAILGAGTTDEAAQDAERLVRLVIYSHCGQKFTRARKTYRLRGNGKNFIELPNRLLQMNTFNGFASLPTNFLLTADGWFIRGGVRGAPNIKADYDGYHEINGRVYNEFNIIPQWFNETNVYVIDGYWGWKSVPAEVKEAAKILLNDYACSDATYRDRYIENVAAVDWKVAFNTRAFWDTGNVKADQLLAPFVLNRGWAVV